MRSLVPFLACSVCFGDPASPMSKGVLAGVYFLMVVVVFVLSSIAFLAFRWSRRAKSLEKHSV